MISIFLLLAYANPADALGAGPASKTFCLLLPSNSHVSPYIVCGFDPMPPNKTVFFLASSYTIAKACLPSGQLPSNFFHEVPSHSHVSLLTLPGAELPPNTISLSR